MGLDTTHNAWHGPYSSFNDFRRAVLKAYDGTDLFDYAGYEMRSKKDNGRISPQLPLTNIEDDGFLILMDHSDCDGLIRWVDCKLVADSLNRVAPKMQSARDMNNAIQFANGCLMAYSNKQDLLFQ